MRDFLANHFVVLAGQSGDFGIGNGDGFNGHFLIVEEQGRFVGMACITLELRLAFVCSNAGLLAGGRGLWNRIKCLTQ